MTSMDDLVYCIRIMQISTDKLQSTCHAECLRRSSLIRSTFLQSRKHFCDLIHSFVKISSNNNDHHQQHLLPVILHNHDRIQLVPCLTPGQNLSSKRKSCHEDAAKRIRLTVPSAGSAPSNASHTVTTD